MEDLNPTTRQYPRTLKEAFPQDYMHHMDIPPKRMCTVGTLMWIASIAIFVLIIHLY